MNLFEGKPESTEEQTARLEKEDRERARLADLAELKNRAAAPLIGRRGDIGQRDLLGGADLFGL